MTENLFSIFALIVVIMFAVVIRVLGRLKRRQQRLQSQLKNMGEVQKFHDINEFRQSAAFLQLHAFLSPSVPLPPMRSWAISPDFALLLVRLISERKPRRIVEFGGGTSTLVCAYCIRQLGVGEILSVDHDAYFADQTRRELQRHGLSRWVDVRLAPLEAATYLDDKGERIEWYADEVVSALPGDIDLVVIDGPPAEQKPFARYPALPAIADRLTQGGLLILDDADRPGEQAVIDRWRQEFAYIDYAHEPTEKGACIAQNQAS
jgi:predicted O-methyltransferase YrrM